MTLHYESDIPPYPTLTLWTPWFIRLSARHPLY
jgi:hypothetical protein